MRVPRRAAGCGEAPKQGKGPATRNPATGKAREIRDAVAKFERALGSFDRQFALVPREHAELPADAAKKMRGLHSRLVNAALARLDEAARFRRRGFSAAPAYVSDLVKARIHAAATDAARELGRAAVHEPNHVWDVLVRRRRGSQGSQDDVPRVPRAELATLSSAAARVAALALEL